MRGISEDKLKEILAYKGDYKMSKPYINAQVRVIQALIDQCEELNPWLKIDENTPKDRELLLKDKRRYRFLGQYDHISDQYKNDCGYTIYPTHYMEMPK